MKDSSVITTSFTSLQIKPGTKSLHAQERLEKNEAERKNIRIKERERDGGHLKMN